jgi:predicted ArsR family transcriptional regulator
MDQLEMFKNVRRNDSDTSFAAAASMETAAKRYKAIVYRTLLHFGPMTSEEIASRCELDHPQVWRRVSDLRRDKMIHDTMYGERRKNSSGRRAAVWAVNRASQDDCDSRGVLDD